MTVLERAALRLYRWRKYLGLFPGVNCKCKSCMTIREYFFACEQHIKKARQK